jgi:hypothetical protein
LLKNYNRKIIKIRQTPLADITSESIVWINDVFEQHELNSMLLKQTPAYIVNDHFTAIEPSDYHVYCAPLWVAKNTRFIVQHLSDQQTYQTRHIFNFMINKKQINRFLCMKLIEFFKLNSYDYTWSGVDSNFDMTVVLNELKNLGESFPLNTEQQSLLLSAIKIPKKFFHPTEIIDNCHINYPDNSWTWNTELNKIFSSSATSLITESLSFQRSTVFTEKTVYALLGKTFPLWVGGGAHQAHHLEKMGFDVFNDVIDHSYQNYNTLIERCYYAFKRNLHILSDYEYASEIRQLMMDRLEHNQQLIKNKHIDNFCKLQIEQWPEDLQRNISSELKHWL